LIFLFDGEEEAGSPHLGEYLTRYRDRVSPIDIWLFFDGPVHQSGRPQITFGVRGSMGLEVTVYGATRELHSGHYGNWAPDTPLILARLLASMKDDNGKVLVQGWYDSAAPIGPEERAALKAMPDYDAELKRELGLAWTEGQPASLPERLLLPALTIRGISGGNTGSLAANVIPTTATAALGIRLVKGNEPDKMRELIVRHIERQGFHVVTSDPDMATRLKYPKIAKLTVAKMRRRRRARRWPIRSRGRSWRLQAARQIDWHGPAARRPCAPAPARNRSSSPPAWAARCRSSCSPTWPANPPWSCPSPITTTTSTAPTKTCASPTSGTRSISSRR
jgi:acetylornithine deacetylase/succinyl-diaminopimelate desuccinylase-like protein